MGKQHEHNAFLMSHTQNELQETQDKTCMISSIYKIQMLEGDF